MPHYDLTVEELEQYRPEREEPDDFEAFWALTLKEARSHPVDLRRRPTDSRYRELVTEDVDFRGYDGHRVKAWFLAPRHAKGALPVVVSYLGYGGGRGLVGSWTQLPSAGVAHLVMDTRGQGSGFQVGDTPDPGVSGPHAGGVMTLGIDDPKSYYFRRVFSDAVRAVDAARTHPLVDPTKVVVSGASQGGGIALAAAGLADDLAAVVADVPFLCAFRRATSLVNTSPYGELVRYLSVHRDAVDRTFHTLSYFDAVNLASRASAPALFSVALMDDVCPPSTVYSAFNHYGGPKDMIIYPFNGHEGGNELQQQRSLDFILSLVRG